MSSTSTCPDCGAELQANGPVGGMCPACLMQSAGNEPTEIGNYRLLGKIGEGGMGVVYEAEQSQPVQRRVALKLVKWGMDTREVVARFEAERQALALMEHPNIARVLDAGATDRGRPYFVMEHVPGVPITEYCDRERQGTEQRLRLFVRVCDAVQHAHQKGIIHRDLKPSNVLVTVRDGEAVPKVIDFGVAKATAQRLTEHTVYTELGRQIGTPEYMSPEQAERSELDVDTRTDVYSLGVLLYELLVGELPFDSKQLREASWEEMRRMIRETDPPRPSVRAVTLDPSSAQRRRTEPTSLARRLRGDLDWIVMKALEKDRTRRYGTATELAADLERYLRHEPVSAGPPGITYRVGKFVRRHRVGVTAAAVVVAALLIGAVSLAFGLVRALRAEQRAVAAVEAKTQVSEFLKDLFKVSNPSEARGNSITAREVLDKGAQQIDAMLREQPETRAELKATIGEVYDNLGLHAQAEPLLEQAIATRTRLLGEDDPQTLASRSKLALVHLNQGRFDESERTYRDILERRRRILGEEHPATLSARLDLCYLYRKQRRPDDAEPLCAQALEAQKRVLPADHPDLLRAMDHLAVVYTDQGRFELAEPLYLESLEAQKRVLGDDHPGTLALKNNLARLYFRQDRLAEAETLFGEALETRRRIQGDEHPATLRAMNNLAYLYQTRERWDDAQRLYLEALATHRRVQGEDHPDTASILYNLACFEATRGAPDKALEWLAAAVDTGRADPDLMVRDGDLESLRELPEFEALVERARVAAATRQAVSGS